MTPLSIPNRFNPLQFPKSALPPCVVHNARRRFSKRTDAIGTCLCKASRRVVNRHHFSSACLSTIRKKHAEGPRNWKSYPRVK